MSIDISDYVLRMSTNEKFNVFPMFLLSVVIRRVKTWLF